MNKKILNYEEFRSLRSGFRKDGQTVVHCHGVFDLVHPGHIIHLQEARKKGDILVVSITSAPYVQKGPDRPYFNDELRALSLAALEIVDYVLISHSITALEIIDVIQPDLYIKGEEYKISENDVTANIDREAEAVRVHGGQIAFTQGAVFSSTKLINNSFSVLSAELLEIAKKLKIRYNIKTIQDYVEGFKDIKVLVVGDAIIDEYEFCDVQGLMSKDQALSTKSNHTEQYLGGAFAIARHLSELSERVTFCSIVGTESPIQSQILSNLSSKMILNLDYNENQKTIVKRKYIQKNKLRNEYRKLFSINYIQDYTEQDKIDKEAFYTKLKKEIDKNDMIVLCDYGHGLVDDVVMAMIQESGKFISLNCQTNSSNYGLNLITKYNKADTFVLDEKEMKLAFHDIRTENSELLFRLKSHLRASMGWLTLGSSGAVGINQDNKTERLPSTTLDVVDTVGAGDAFFSIVSLCAYRQVPLELATLLGNIAGAIASNVVGNSESITKAKVLKYASTILNV